MAALLREQDDKTLFAKGRNTDECVDGARKSKTRKLEIAKDRAL
jgi:hypothetical protein